MGSVANQENVRGSGNRDHKHKRSTAHLVIAGAIAITDEFADILAIDQGGTTRVITLPPATEQNEGRSHIFIAVNATNNLTINNAAAATLATITPGEWGMAIQVKGVWYAIVIPPAA